MKQSIAFLLAGATSLACLPVLTFAASGATNTFSVPYIERIGDASYRIHILNGGNDVSKLSLSADSQELTIPKILDQDSLIFNNYKKAAGDISITKTSTVPNSAWDGETTLTEKSEAIKLRNETKISLKQSSVVSTKFGSDSITSVAFDTLVNDDTTSQPETQKIYKISVNGTDFPLLTGETEYVKGKYYRNAGRVSFLTSNLDKTINTLRLKVDGLSSNYVIIKKEIYKLTAPKFFQITFEDKEYVITWTFDMPEGTSNVNDFEATVNSEKLDKKKILSGQSQFTIKYPLTKLTAGNLVNIFISDPIGNVSNTITFSPDSSLTPKITKLSLGNGKEKSFDFWIDWPGYSFFWDILQIIININGEEYTFVGKQVALTESGSSTPVTDSDGHPRYEIKNKIDIRKTMDGVAFAFYYADLKDGENIIFIKNGNTGRTSNKVSFKKGDYDNINYAADNKTDSKTWGEKITFEKVSDTLGKKIDFISAPQKDIPLGKLTIDGLDPKEYYHLAFKIRTNTKIIPLTDLSLNGTILEPFADTDGTISYGYDRSALGSSLTSGNIVFTLNELFNLKPEDFANPSDTMIRLNISGFTLEKSQSDQTWKEVAKDGATYQTNIRYLYTFGPCFDNSKWECKKAGLATSILSLDIASGKIPEVIPAWELGASPDTGRINRSGIVTIEYSTRQFRWYNEQFKNLYENIKSRGLTATQVMRSKRAINAILQALKNVESGSQTAKAAKQTIRDNVREIKASITNQ